MKKNVGSVDKAVRVIIAIVAAYFAYSGQNFIQGEWVTYVLWAVAIIMLLTVLISSCPIYSIFGASSNKAKE